MSQPPVLPDLPWFRRTDAESDSDDDREESEQKRFRSQEEGLPELHPHQYDRVMGAGSGHASQDSLNPILHPTGLATPIPISEHCSYASDISGTPGVGQVSRASAKVQEVLHAQQKRLQGPAACASARVKRGFVDLILPPQFCGSTNMFPNISLHFPSRWWFYTNLAAIQVEDGADLL